jgi:DNA-binding response OmpR family regulator
MAPANLLLCKEGKQGVDSLERYLRRQGHRIRVISSCDQLDHVFADWAPDLILIDSETAGCEALERVRKKTTRPIIVMTKLGRADDRVRGLQGGADDVVSQPVDAAELDARIQAVLRRIRPELGGLNLVVDDLRKEVRVDSRVVALSPKEFQLLKLLASSPGRVFTTQEILEELWPRSTTSYATGQDVQKYVYLLRKKLEENPAQPTLVLTVRGFGYRLAV